MAVYIRRFHRIVGAVWILSLALALAVDAAGTELPGPSIPGLSFIALVLTGSYLLFRPWVRGSTTVADRLKGLTTWTRTPAVVIRRTHRIAAGLFLLFLAIALLIAAAGGPESPVFLIRVVALLLYLALTGTYMFLRPWVNRVRTG